MGLTKVSASRLETKKRAVTRPTISKLLNGKADLSPEMALRIEKAFGISMDTLLRMQVSFDIAQACKKSAAIKVPRYVPEPSAA